MQNYRIRPFTTGQASRWVSSGWRLWRRRPLAVTGPVAVFVLFAMLLRLIPVIGDVVLLLLLPSVMASYLIEIHILTQTAGGRAGRGKITWRQYLTDLQRVLFGAWNKPENIFPLVIIGFVLVVIGLIAYALLAGVGGQVVVSPYGFFELTPPQMGQLLLAYGLVVLLWLAIAAVLLWTLPLFAIHDVALVAALVLGLRGLRHNGAAVAVLLAVTAAMLLPAAMLRLWSPLAGAVALWLLATAASMLMVFSAYCSFRLVFAPVTAARAADSVSRQPVARRS
jgi:hypothetical protein